MARKNAAKKKEEEVEVDSLLDEVLGIEEPDTENDDADPERQELPLGDDPPDSEREEEEGELETSSEDSQESEDEVSPPSDSADLEVEVEGEDEDDELTAKEKQGLLKEIAELRRRLSTPPPPAPPTYAQPPPPPPSQSTAIPGRVPVLVSEDGMSVYTDPDATRAEMERIARQLITEAQTPTPQQLNAMENSRAVQDYVSRDPERNQAVANRMKEADDFIALHIQNLAAEGHQIGSVRDAINVMRERGLDQNVIKYFPEIADNFDEFIEGSASGKATWRRSLLERFGSHSADRTPEPTTARGKDLVPNISNLPQSLTRKGGTRTTSTSSDESEFELMSAEFSEEVIFYPEKKFRRLQDLGKKLGKPGYV